MTTPIDAIGSDAIGHPFADPSLLEQALTHASYANENDGPDYERLEFLGDAVLQLCTTAWIVERFPDAGEGQLSRLRQRLVSTPALAGIAARFGIDGMLRLGVGEESSGGRTRPTVLAGAVEAVLGAVFCDGGFAAAEALVRRWLGDAVDALAAGETRGWKDPRNLLQELTQRDMGQTPTYEVTRTEGPPHQPVFEVEVRIVGRVLGRGTGTSKQEAAKMAAEDALTGPSRTVEPAPLSGEAP